MSERGLERTTEWLRRYDEAVAPVLPSYFDVVADRAEGAWIWDVEGRRFLDLGSGIGVTNTGHRHPRVTAAIHAQVDRLLHTSVVVKHQPYIEAAEAVAGLAPFLDRPQVFFCNSGAEAVEGALKLARWATSKPGIVAFRRGFHGRTLATTSMTTAKTSYQEGYAPLLPEVRIAPYCITGPTSGHPSTLDAVEAALAALDALLASGVAATPVGAMVVEPVLGEGGYVVAPIEWLEGLRERCDQHGILLIFDEVQCGMGRTGRPFAAEATGVTPDVVVFAKGIASGLPLGGLIASSGLMATWPNGSHGSTFGGNPVSCAAAVATIQVLREERLCERATVIGDRVRRRLVSIEVASIVEVRGIGAMIGLELSDKETTREVQRRCLDAGVLVLTCGPDGNVIRLVPPLTITDEELDLGLHVLEGALRST